MANEIDKLKKLISFSAEFDNFGRMDKDMSLLSVAIGTLRKDQSIASDIASLAESDSDGLGMIILSRVLIEDYLHLLYINDNPDNLTENITDFNLHPHIEHYASIVAMRDWGIDLSDDESVRITTAIKKNFEANKERFRRRGRSGDEFNADDFYRTWTKKRLDDVIKETSLTRSGLSSDLKSLRLASETYDTASTVVHHNSFNIWLLANQGISISKATYAQIALMVSVISFSKMINLVLKIALSRAEDQERLAESLNTLADII